MNKCKTTPTQSDCMYWRKKRVEIQYKFGELNFLTSKNNYQDLAH